MTDIQKKIKQDSDPQDVINLFHEHFNQKYLDKLIITLVINTVLHIVRTYCDNKQIKTLFLAIDGVPSKGKMIEQRQRRYLSTIVDEYKKLILKEYKDYLLELEDYTYLANKDSIKWSRGKITPGTAFMHKMVSYLRSEKIINKFKTNRQEMEIIISDMYEVGEGEKKIVNYINKFFNQTSDNILVYSPDADMILLCMLLPVKKISILRHNQQTGFYDVIDVNMLKDNISYYVNNAPGHGQENFKIERISYDIVCISTLFGNDFVPKMETIDVKRGFQNIMDAYLRTLLQFKDKNYYLVKKSNGGKFELNFVFLKQILKNLIPIEDDFIKHNNLYGKYINLGQIKNAFDYMEINAENLVSTYNEFRQEYENLKNLIKNNGNYTYFETHDQFMDTLKKTTNIIVDGESVNLTYLSNHELIELLKNYYRTNRDFPRININLNTFSKSIKDMYHQRKIKEKNIINDYQKEVYKFDNMLDHYHDKFNAQPLHLSRDKIFDYYKNYFHINQLFDKNTKGLTNDSSQLMHDYFEGMLWVFDYYYNDPTYINKWYYKYERAPLIKQLVMFLDTIDQNYLNNVLNGLKKYQVHGLENYFNPIEQLIYVSPMTENAIKLLPSNYQKYIESDDRDPFLNVFFVDTKEVAKRLWDQKISGDIDCRGIPFFNKCIVKSIHKPTESDDKQFLKAIRKVKPNAASIRRSKNEFPDY